MSYPARKRTPTKSPSKAALRDEGGAESGALAPDLVTVVTAWSDLPETIKAGILALVRAAGA
jgi:hypothetical protein